MISRDQTEIRMSYKYSDKASMSSGYVYLVVALLCIPVFYSALLPRIVSILLLMSSCILSFNMFLKKGSILQFDLKSWGALVFWLFAGIYILLCSVLSISADSFSSMALALVIFISLLTVRGVSWIEPAVYSIAALLVVFPLVTVVTYTTIFKPLFLAAQPMAVDYRAGLTSHYSVNGSLCAFAFIFYSCLSLFGPSNKHKVLFRILAVASFVALLLTTKRSQLICALLAIVICYLGSGVKNKGFKIFFTTIATLLVMSVVVPMVPGFEASINRLFGTFSSGASVEDSLSGRTILWDYAIEGWLASPIFGNGWGSYYFVWPDGITVSNMAHNELLNLLFEVGLFGSICVLLFLIYTLSLTLKMIRKTDDSSGLSLLMLSLALQIFLIVYGFSSGSIFGLLNHATMYFFAVSIIYAFQARKSCRSIKYSGVNDGQ